MLSPKTLQSYREMTPSERLRLTLQLSRSAWRALSQGNPEIVNRRFLRLRQENEQRNRRISDGLKRCDPLNDDAATG
jgi:hypothetical protein